VDGRRGRLNIDGYVEMSGEPIRNKVTGPSDTRVQQMTAWISGLTLPRPNYGINYPVGGAPPAPEKSPATAPAGRGR